MSPASKKYDKLFAVFLFAGSLILSISVLLIPLDTNQLATFGYGGIFLVTLLGAMTLFIPGPTMIAAFAIGSVLNPLVVSIIAGLGSAIGETTGYVAGYASRSLISAREEKNTWYWRIFRWMSKYPFLTIFLLDAIPNFIADLAGLAAGRIRYPYHKFLLASFLGKSIRFGIGAYLGFGFGQWLLPK